jgi:hypothetical protein
MDAKKIISDFLTKHKISKLDIALLIGTITLLCLLFGIKF